MGALVAVLGRGIDVCTGDQDVASTTARYWREGQLSYRGWQLISQIKSLPFRLA